MIFSHILLSSIFVAILFQFSIGYHFSKISAFKVTLQRSDNRIISLAASRPGAGSGGSTKLDTRTVTSTKPTYRDEIEKDWRLILHDDNVHTIQQVCEILSKSCPLCSGSRAYEVTLQVHMTGAATVAVANKKAVTEYSKALQMAGLTISMAPDDEFEPESEE